MRHMLYDGHTWVWQRPDGSCMLGDSGEGEEASEAAGAALLAHAACMLPGLAHARVEEVAVGYRPWPQVRHVH